MSHLQKHLIHALFFLAMVVAVRVTDFAISGVALVGVVVLSLATLELGLWVIHRRDEPVESTT